MEFREAFFEAFRQNQEPGHLRLAPTPSGYLHSGNGLNFIFIALLSKRHPDSSLLLRIDDLDRERKRPEYVEDVFRSLEWLGIEWTSGPESPEDFEKNWTQETRMHLYEDALLDLVKQEKVFPCGLSRSTLSEYGTAYPKELREQNLSLDTPNVNWRLNTGDHTSIDDFVVRKKDGRPSYHLACVVDDIHFKIDTLVRGEDLLQSTIEQQFLATILRSGDPFLNIKVLHHPLLKSKEGIKLSKSEGANALKSIRESGARPKHLYWLASQWLGLDSDAIDSLDALHVECLVSQQLS